MIRGAVLELLLTLAPFIGAWAWYVGRSGYRDRRVSSRRRSR